MEQFDSSEEESSRVLEQQQRNDEQQCPSWTAELTETSVWTTAANETDCMGWSDQQGSLAVERGHQITKFGEFEIYPLPDWKPVQAP